MFRGRVKGTGYPLHSPVSSSLPLPCVNVCHHISAGVYNQSRFQRVLNVSDAKFGSEHEMSRFIFPRHANTSLIIRMKILTFTQWEKATIGLGASGSCAQKSVEWVEGY